MCDPLPSTGSRVLEQRPSTAVVVDALDHDPAVVPIDHDRMRGVWDATPDVIRCQLGGNPLLPDGPEFRVGLGSVRSLLSAAESDSRPGCSWGQRVCLDEHALQLSVDQSLPQGPVPVGDELDPVAAMAGAESSLLTGELVQE